MIKGDEPDPAAPQRANAKDPRKTCTSTESWHTWTWSPFCQYHQRTTCGVKLPTALLVGSVFLHCYENGSLPFHLYGYFVAIRTMRIVKYSLTLQSGLSFSSKTFFHLPQCLTTRQSPVMVRLYVPLRSADPAPERGPHASDLPRVL